jgi:hypothetical protein
MDYMTGLSLFLAGVGLAATVLVGFAYWLRHRRDGRKERQLELPLNHKAI